MNTHINENGSLALSRTLGEYFPGVWDYEDRGDDFVQCIACGRKVGDSPVGIVVSNGGDQIVHPDSAPVEMLTDGWLGWWPLGSECAKSIPSEFLTK